MECKQRGGGLHAVVLDLVRRKVLDATDSRLDTRADQSKRTICAAYAATGVSATESEPAAVRSCSSTNKIV